VRNARVKRSGATAARCSSANSRAAAVAKPGVAADPASTSSRTSRTTARTIRSCATRPSGSPAYPARAAISRTRRPNVSTSPPKTVPEAASSR
jgi:hypothetical protein